MALELSLQVCINSYFHNQYLKCLCWSPGVKQRHNTFLYSFTKEQSVFAQSEYLSNRLLILLYLILDSFKLKTPLHATTHAASRLMDINNLATGDVKGQPTTAIVNLCRRFHGSSTHPHISHGRESHSLRLSGLPPSHIYYKDSMSILFFSDTTLTALLDCLKVVKACTWLCPWPSPYHISILIGTHF